MMSALLGQAGIGEDEVNAIAPWVAEIHADLQAQRRAGALPFYELPYQTAEVALAKKGRPTCALTLPVVNPFTLGQLL